MHPGVTLTGLHDERDADALLSHLVTLNAQRAAEEKAGDSRWLRPSFQDPIQAKSLSNNELSTTVVKGLQADLALDSEQNPATTATHPAAPPWPSALPDQMRALAQMLSSQAGTLTLADIEARFKGRGPWKKSLSRILETLEALGRARREGDGWQS